MIGGLAYVAAVIGIGLAIRGVADWATCFFAASAILIAWRFVPKWGRRR